jgi:glycosyltransferase involved in cell wall biosynthesis
VTLGTRVCAVSFKECWQSPEGDWYSDGGFPLQMAAVASLFDAMTLLITRRDSPGEGGLRLPGGAEVVELRKPAGEDFRRKLSVLGNLRHYISTIAHFASRADCIHVPPPGDIPLLGMLVALALRKRLIVRYCGSWVKTGQTTLMNRVTRGLMRAFAGGRNVMLATGEAEEPPAPRIAWIFATAISEEELRLTVPVASRGLSEPPQVAYVGRLAVAKGVAVLLAALALMKREGFQPLPHVWLIGDGPERKRLGAHVDEQGLRGLVSFAGQLNRRALSSRLSKVDFCVQPSLTEGYSKAYLDAFAHGLPVLCSEAGAARRVIGGRGERGWLVPPGDVRALAGQLRRVLSEPQDWESLRRGCREFAENRTLEVWARQIGQQCARQWDLRLIEGKLVS